MPRPRFPLWSSGHPVGRAVAASAAAYRVHPDVVGVDPARSRRLVLRPGCGASGGADSGPVGTSPHVRGGICRPPVLCYPCRSSCCTLPATRKPRTEKAVQCRATFGARGAPWRRTRGDTYVGYGPGPTLRGACAMHRSLHGVHGVRCARAMLVIYTKCTICQLSSGRAGERLHESAVAVAR